MLIWMAYATLAGALLSACGAVLEHASPWLSGRRRFLWLAILCAILSLTATAIVAPHRSVDAPGAMVKALPTSRVVSPPVEAATTVIEQGARVQLPHHTATPDGAPSLGDPALGIDALLLMLWLAGTTLCLAVLAVSAWRVAHLRRTWQERVISGVPVFVSHDVGPAVIGLVHHGIVVPAWVEALSADAQRTVMTHEREHVRAGDPMLLWGATLLVSITPWNFALWYALRRLRHAIEIDCDSRVLRSRPDTHAYCTLLLDVGERTLAGVAPVAALAEPSTLLERRIEAMTQPRRARLGGVVGSTAMALALLAAACVTPRPEIAPAARVSALVTELNALLAHDSVRQSFSSDERSRLAGVLLASAQSVLPSGDGSRSATDNPEVLGAPRSLAVPKGFEGGSNVVKLAHDSFPEVFQPHDGAIAVLTVYDSAFHPLTNYVKDFRLDEVFDVRPGLRDSVIKMRDASYVISRVIPGWHSRLSMYGSQTQSTSPHTVFLWTVLVPGDTPPRAQEAEDRAGVLTLHGSSDVRIPLHIADSVARGLYPETFFPHDGLPVVALIFSESGQLLRHGIRHAAHDEVFMPTRDPDAARGESSRGGDELLSLVFAGMPARAGRWSTVAHRTEPAPALVWTVLPAGSTLPSPRADAADRDVGGGRTASLSHREARVTLSGDGSAERWIRVYAAGMTNTVEAGAVRNTVRDTLRLRLPTMITLDIGPGDGVTFESEDGQPFKFSALVAGREKPTEVVSGRVMLHNSGATLTTPK